MTNQSEWKEVKLDYLFSDSEMETISNFIKQDRWEELK
jgi:hypothetical protein